MLYLPTPRHLFDDKTRIQPRFDERLRVDLLRRLKCSEQPAILRNVVRDDAEIFVALRQQFARRRLTYDGAIAGRSGIAARAAVSFDDEPARAHRPESGVRTRIRRHSSHRSTASGAATLSCPSSDGFTVRWQPSHRPR